MPTQEMAPAQPMAPPPAPVAQPPAFTPVTSPLGPDPFEVRRTEAAAELEALKAREEQERIAREAEAKRISDLELAERQRQEQLNLISLENARVRDLRLAEEKRLADEQAAAVAPVTTAPAPAPAPAPVVEAAPAPQTPVEPYFVTTNYESGEGYTVYPPGYVETDFEPYDNRGNAWYAGDGG
jgi:translation initiation factor IF-2